MLTVDEGRAETTHQLLFPPPEHHLQQPEQHSTTRPAFATVILNVARSDPSSAYTLTFRDQSGGTISVQTIAGSAFLTSPIYLSPDVVDVVVTGAANGASARVIFGLAL